MRASELLAELNRVIDLIDAEAISPGQSCLMLTGTWYEDFPIQPKAVAIKPDGRRIFLLTHEEGIQLRDFLADPERELSGTELDVQPKASREAVGERMRVWERDSIKRLVARQPRSRSAYLGRRHDGGPLEGPQT